MSGHGSTRGTLFLPCRVCGRMRTLTVRLYAGGIRSAMDRPCLTCSRRVCLAPSQQAGGQAARAADLAAELQWMRDTPENAARRLGTTVSALARLFYRASMPEQARPFMRAETRARYQRKAAA